MCYIHNYIEMGVTDKDLANSESTPWLLLVFSLPSKRASERVEVWRKLRRFGTIALKSSGYVLPNTAMNQERFEWLATTVRGHKGQASVAQVQRFDDMPNESLRKEFLAASSKEYEVLSRDLRKLVSLPTARRSQSAVARLRKRFQEIREVDFFESPMRSRVETLFARLDEPATAAGKKTAAGEYRKRTWITRPRPGIDRVSSGWLIRRFIDPEAQFTFGSQPTDTPEAVPFDMFQGGGFGHRGEDCTFETLCKEFAIRDKKVKVIAEMVHDADLHDEKFGRTEGMVLERVLKGWAQMDLDDHELLERGMNLIEGLYGATS
jgi:hypothetical protein